MSANSSLAIRIAAIFDNKGIKQAGKEVKGLQGAVKKLAGAAGIGLSTAAVINFGKNAAKAFIADEKAASQLAQAVKNLGLSFEVPRIEKFISELSKASGVTDDELRPAMQKLLQTTGSVAKSQELLTQALDISRGSGVDYGTVVEDLTKAYVGQTRGLNKYKLGVTQAELKTMSFADVQDKLGKQFSGANAAYLETYAGKMGILSTAASEATEIIGKGLVDSLSILAGDGNTVQPLADSMEMLATEISSVITGLAEMIAYFKELPGMDFYLKNIFPKLVESTELGRLVKLIQSFNKETSKGAGRFFAGGSGGAGFNIEEERTRRRIEAEAAKRAKELAALQKKTLDTQKKSLALQKASKTLNLEAIGIEAALKGKISETDRISLLLQKAVLEGNATLATQLSDQLEAAIKRNEQLRLALLSTPKAPNPYEDWKIPADLLAYTAATLGVSAETIIKAPETIGIGVTDATQELIDALIAAAEAQRKAEAAQAAAESGDVYVSVKVGEEDLSALITSSQTNSSLSGSFVGINRSGFKGAVATQ
jgi:hypothetical protein